MFVDAVMFVRASLNFPILNGFKQNMLAMDDPLWISDGSKSGSNLVHYLIRYMLSATTDQIQRFEFTVMRSFKFLKISIF